MTHALERTAGGGYPEGIRWVSKVTGPGVVLFKGGYPPEGDAAGWSRTAMATAGYAEALAEYLDAEAAPKRDGAIGRVLTREDFLTKQKHDRFPQHLLDRVIDIGDHRTGGAKADTSPKGGTERMGGNGSGTFEPLDEREIAVLRWLSKQTKRVRREQVCPDLPAPGDQKALRPILDHLHDCGYTYGPPRGKKGVAILERGREYLRSLDASG